MSIEGTETALLGYEDAKDIAVSGDVNDDVAKEKDAVDDRDASREEKKSVGAGGGKEFEGDVDIDDDVAMTFPQRVSAFKFLISA
jgi:hypothetical protein